MKHINRILSGLVLMGLCVALVFGSVSTVSAQGPATNPDLARILGDAVVDATIKATGLTESELLRELTAGKSFTQIITDKGGDVAKVKADVKTALTAEIAKAVQAGTITQAQADLFTKNLDNAIDRVMNAPRGVGNAGNPRGLVQDAANVLREAVRIVADAVKMAPAELMRELAGGKSLEEVITEKGGDVAKIKADVVKAVTEAITKAVSDGKLPQAQADRLLANLSARVDEIFAEERGVGGRDGLNVRDRVLDGLVAASLIAETARAASMTQREIVAELRDGKTLNQIIADKKADAQAIITATTKVITDRVNQMVTNGRIEKAQADEYLAGLADAIKRVLDEKNPVRGELVGPRGR